MVIGVNKFSFGRRISAFVLALVLFVTGPLAAHADGYDSVNASGSDLGKYILVGNSGSGTAKAMVNGEEVANALPGTRVYLSATVNAGAKAYFSHWSVIDDAVTIEDPLSPETSFIMGDTAVQITAHFLNAEIRTVLYSVGTTGASGEAESQSKYDGETVVLRDRSFMLDGSYQTGWSVNSDGSTKDYELNDDYTDNQDITLYPYFEKIHTVTFKPGIYAKDKEDVILEKLPGETLYLKGSVSVDDKGIHTYSDIFESNRELFRQEGWSLSADGTVKDYEIGAAYDAEADMVLYPYWQTVYKITYANDSYGTKIDADADYFTYKYFDEPAILENTMFTRVGYIQNGWSVTKGSSTVDYSFSGEYVTNSSITLYPVWKQNCMVTYVPGAGIEGKAVSQTKYYQKALTLKGQIYKREGYVQLGWATVEGADSAEYALNGIYSADKNIVLYPVWKPVTYGLWVSNVQVTGANKSDVLGDSTVSFDPETETLTLKGANIIDLTDECDSYSGSNAAIYALNESDGIHSMDVGLKYLNIEPIGANVINVADDGYADGIYSCCPITINGSGTLDISCDHQGIYVEDNDEVENTIEAAFVMLSGSLSINADLCGIMSYVEERGIGVLVEGGNLSIIVSGLNDEDRAVGIDSTGAIDYKAFVMDGGNLDISILNSGKSGSKAAGLYAASEDAGAVEINGGNLNISVSDGVAISPDMYAEELPKDFVAAMVFNGGDITLYGSKGSIDGYMILDVDEETEFYDYYISINDEMTVYAGNSPEEASETADYIGREKQYKYARFSGADYVKEEKTINLWIGTERVTENNLSGSGWNYDPTSRSLFISNLDATRGYVWDDEDRNDYNAIIYSEDDLNIVFSGVSTIGDEDLHEYYGIYCEGKLTLSGDGCINTYGEFGIYATGLMTVESGKIIAVGEDSGISGDNINNSLIINGGEVIATGNKRANSKGITSFDRVTFNAGSITATGNSFGASVKVFNQHGGAAYFEAKGTITGSLRSNFKGLDVTTLYVSAGELEAKACGYGIDAEHFTLTGGNVAVYCTDKRTGLSKSAYSYALYLRKSLTVNGGKLYAEGLTRAASSNERYSFSYTQKGGEVVLRTTEKNVAEEDKRSPGASTAMTIYDGTITIRGGLLDVEGPHYAILIGNEPIKGSAVSGIKFYDGSIKAKVTDKDSSLTGKYAVNGVFLEYPSLFFYKTKENGSLYCYQGTGFAPAPGKRAYFEITNGNLIIYKPGSGCDGAEIRDLLSNNTVNVIRGETYYRDDYAQVGWSVTEGGTLSYNFGDEYTDSVDLILYPYWLSAFEITYLPGDAEEEDSYVAAKPENNSIVLRDRSYTRAGYVQNGWTTTIGGDKEYELNGVYSDNASLSLYPSWTDTVKITYNPGTLGIGDTKGVSVNIGDHISLMDRIYERAGYYQAGWSLTDGGKMTYALGEEIDVEDELSLYPVWVRGNIISYKPGTSIGSGTIKETAGEASEYYDVKTYGVDYTLKEAVYVYEKGEGEEVDYVMFGWSTSDGGEKEYDLGEVITVDAPLVLYPVFVPDKLWIDVDCAKKVSVAGSTDTVSVFEYSTLPQKPAVNVYDGSKLLKLNKDYSVSYKNNTNKSMVVADLADSGVKVSDSALTAKEKAALPQIVVTGKGNYAGTEICYFSIAPKSIAAGDFAYSPDFLYEYAEKSGKPVVNKPGVTVSQTLVNKKVKKLGAKKEFLVSYYNAVLADGEYQTDSDGNLCYDGEALTGISEAGKYVVVVEGVGNYTGKHTIKAEITNKKLITKTSFKNVTNKNYNNGISITQDSLAVYYGKLKLEEGTDYIVGYSNNKAVGTATVTVTGINDYLGSKSATFKINGTALSKMKIEGFVSKYEYKHYKEYKQDSLAFYYIDKDKQKQYLTEGKDYTVSYSNNTLPGTATVIYTGKGGYTGTVKKTFSITGIPMSKVTVNNFTSQSFVYDGMPHGLEFSTEAVNHKESKAVYLTYKSVGSNKETVITPVPLLTARQFENHLDGYFVRYIEDTTKKGNNVSVGTATVELVGSGKYTGVVKKSFKITAYDINKDLSDRVSVVYDDRQVYTKGKVTPEVKVLFKNGDGETVTLTAGKDYTLSYLNNTAFNDLSNPKKLPTVKLVGKGNYSGTRAIEYFAIDKRDINTVNAVAVDKAYNSKADNYTTTVTLTDINNGKMAAGTDYEKNITYVYAQDVTVINKGISYDRSTGDTVVKGDIVPASETGTRMKMIITGRGNYYGTKEIEYLITKASITSVKVEFNKKFYFDNMREVRPTKDDFVVKVKVGKNWEILDGSNYEIVADSYAGNTLKGTGSFVLHGLGNYGGKLTVKFTILAKGFSWWFFR